MEQHGVEPVGPTPHRSLADDGGGCDVARAALKMDEVGFDMLVEAAARAPVEDVIARARRRVQTTGSRVDAAAILAARDVDRR